MAILYIGFFIFIHYTKQGDLEHVKSSEGFHIKDLPLLLLPMTPIVRYIILNQDILSSLDSIALFAIFSVVSFVMTILVPAMLGIIGARKILMITGASFSYALFNMASLASDFSWHLSGSAGIQLIVLAIFFTVPMIIYFFDKKFLNTAVILFFAISTLASLASSQELKNQIKRALYIVDKPAIYAYTKDKKPERKPDIFLLTYDSYVENETMLKYGIDNKAQEDYLIQNGFYIYRGAYSVSVTTKQSMGRVLDISRTLHIPRQSWQSFLIGSEFINFSSAAVSGNGAVHNILKENGYKTMGIFSWDYFFQKTGSSYDYSFPSQGGNSIKLLAGSIFEGEFRFDADFYRITYFEYMSKKREALKSKNDKPIFLYTHSWYPGHSSKSGRVAENEIDLFKERLVRANEEMREDVEAIKKSDPDAIIIVNGDHGPHLTKNRTLAGPKDRSAKSEIDRYGMQDRFGSFLAIKWPEGANIDHDKIKILQDIFPLIFSYLYNDPSILKSRIEQLTLNTKSTGGARVRNGIIEGGKDDGKMLFESMRGNNLL